MKHEPPIDRARLVEAIRQSYDLPVVGLEFRPVGYAAASYVVRTEGARYFLKVWPDPHTHPEAIERLPLLRALHDRAIDLRVPCPSSTREGALWSSMQGVFYALYTFLDGHQPPPWSEWPQHLRDEYARIFATLHCATSEVSDVLPPAETFDMPVEPVLHAALDRLVGVGDTSREGLQALRSLLLPLREEILEQLARLHTLQEIVRQLPGPRVLCHTDLGLENLLVDDDGHLSVLDWDYNRVAPPEHDLHEPARLDGFERFLATYRACGVDWPLHIEHFAFYLLRRYLDDMAARVVRILERNTTWQEDEYDLSGITEWGIDSWRRLDRTLQEIERAL